MIRALTPEDAAALEALLSAHADTSLIPRSNLRAVGLAWSGRPFEAQYVGRWEGGALRGVVGHAWNGMLLLQAPAAAGALAIAALEASGRRPAGLLGPWAQVEAAREALGLSPERFRLREEEVLMAIACAQARGPGEGVRAARPGDLEVLAPWRIAFEREALFNPAPDALGLRAGLERSIEAGALFVLEEAGAVHAMGAFTARLLPEAVQLGGIYTPPELRGRGCARRLVAGMLGLSGAARAVLFTKDAAARRAYLAVGFEVCGTFGLALLA